MKRPHNFKNEVGNKYGRLLVLEYAYTNRIAFWRCLCDCENIVIVQGARLRNGSSKSCGCLSSELSSERAKKLTGKNNPMYGRKGDKHPMYGKRGKDCPNWKDGITPENHILRMSLKSKQWKTSVFERDNYTCQICKDNKGGNLNAHHILRWSKFKSLRFTLANGITLCKDCHKVIHSKKYNDQPAIHKFLMTKIPGVV